MLYMAEGPVRERLREGIGRFVDTWATTLHASKEAAVLLHVHRGSIESLESLGAWLRDMKATSASTKAVCKRLRELTQVAYASTDTSGLRTALRAAHTACVMSEAGFEEAAHFLNVHDAKHLREACSEHNDEASRDSSSKLWKVMTAVQSGPEVRVPCVFRPRASFMGLLPPA